jgi:hypothetical protein
MPVAVAAAVRAAVTTGWSSPAEIATQKSPPIYSVAAVWFFIVNL